MEFMSYLNVIIWMDVRVCFPFTVLAIGLCCMVHFDKLPITYYFYLLIAIAIQLVTLIAIVIEAELFQLPLCLVIYSTVAMVSLYFRMIIAVERCFFICWPRLDFIRQTKHYTIISILVWVLCLVIFPLLILLGQTSVFFVFALIPSPIFIFSPLRSFMSMPRATSVSAEDKRRILGTFVLLLVNYAVTSVPATSRFIFYDSYSHYLHPEAQIFLILFLLSPFMDLFLLVFMRDPLISCCHVSAAARWKTLQEMMAAEYLSDCNSDS